MTEAVLVAPTVVKSLCLDPHLLGLLLYLRGRHGLPEEFTAPDALAASFQWPLRQLRGARSRALAGGWIVVSVPPRRSQPGRYVFGARCWRDLPDAPADD